MTKPYTRADLMRLATDIRGPQPLDPLRVLATYADPDNWESVHARDDRGPRHYWAWKGPTIVGWELAGMADDGETEARVARLQRYGMGWEDDFREQFVTKELNDPHLQDYIEATIQQMRSEHLHDGDLP